MFTEILKEPVFMWIVILLLALILMRVFLLFLNSDRQNRKYRQKQEQETDRRRRRMITPKMRRSVLERDDYTCQICGISKGMLDDLLPGLGDYLLLEIDHIKPVSRGGTGFTEDNLQTLCWRCNRKKSDKRTNEETRELIDYGVDYLFSDTDENGTHQGC